MRDRSLGFVRLAAIDASWPADPLARYGPRNVQKDLHLPKYELDDSHADPLDGRYLVAGPKYAATCERLIKKLLGFQGQTHDL